MHPSPLDPPSESISVKCPPLLGSWVPESSFKNFIREGAGGLCTNIVKLCNELIARNNRLFAKREKKMLFLCINLLFVTNVNHTGATLDYGCSVFLR